MRPVHLHFIETGGGGVVGIGVKSVPLVGQYNPAWLYSVMQCATLHFGMF